MIMQALFTISGTVIPGNKLGKRMGYPTANLDLPSESDYYGSTGVYAARVTWKNRVYPGMASIGFRPTIANPSFSVEVHLLDFSEDLYGEEISLHLIKKIRNEMKFNSLDDLMRQMKQDELLIRPLLAGVDQPDAYTG